MLRRDMGDTGYDGQSPLKPLTADKRMGDLIFFQQVSEGHDRGVFGYLHCQW